MPDTVQIGTLLGDDPTLLGKRLTNLDPSFEAVHPVKRRPGIGDSAPGVHDRGHRQVVPHTDIEVVRIVGRRDFDCAGAEFGVDVCVGDDHDLAILEWMRHGGAHQVPVAVIVGVHSDRGITEHGLDPGGRHHDVRCRIIKGAIPE